MNEAARWLAAEAQYLRSCWVSLLKTTVKNESDTRVFVFFGWGYPCWGNGQQVKEKIYMRIYIFTSLPWPYRLLFTPVLGRRVGRTQMEESKTLGCGSLNVYVKVQKNTME